MAATVIDVIPLGIGWGVWEAVAIGSTAMDCVTFDHGGVSCASVTTTGTGALAAVMFVLSAAYLLWNYGVRQGATGASLGKSALGFRVVDEKTWQPIGFSASLLRQLVHVVDAAPCFLGFLFPLWEARRRTLADKLVGTVCVPTGRRSRR